MAESLLIASVKEILVKLISVIGDMNTTWGFKGELKRLSRRCEAAQALLCDAANRQAVETTSVQVWLKNLNSVVTDADDLLDEFAYEALRQKLEVQKRIRNRVSNFFSPSNPLSFRLRMAYKVSNINSMLDQIYKEANEIGLRPVEVINASVDLGEIRQTHPFVDNSEVVGRGGDVSKLVDMLVCSDEEKALPVISIVGMAGLGKTTLAKLVYNHERVMRNFGERIWVCVSHDFNVQRLLNEMVQSLARTTCEMTNTEGIVQRLRESLEGKSVSLY